MSKQQVCVSKVPTDRTKFVGALRLIGRIGLKQASDLAIHLERFRNSIVVAGVEPSIAEHIARVLRESGAEVAVEECSSSTPMLCFPEVNAKHEWGLFRTIKAV